MRTTTFVSRKIATIFVLLALAAPARATTIVGMTERMLARSADAIVIGTVSGIETVGRPDGAIHTLVTLDVERAVKGTVGRRVTLKQAGGRVGDRLLWIAGSPTFAVGQRQLVFLSAGRDGTARTTALGMGQFVLRPHARTGATMAERHVDATVLGQPPVRRVSLTRLLRTIARATAGEALGAAIASTPAEATDPGLTRRTIDEFTTLADPPARWFEPDTSQPVVYDVDPAGDDTLGVTSSLSAIDGAFAAWTNVTGAGIILQRGGSAEPAPITCDGKSQIVFNDPFDEMPAPVACSGVLALGGYCSSGSTTVVNGTTFYRISEGNITFNKGFGGCSFWNTTNLAEVATHQVGHTIGLGHSSEVDGAAPELLDATMHYRAHFDGRGAALRADDIAAVQFIYPESGTCVGGALPLAERITSRIVNGTFTSAYPSTGALFNLVNGGICSGVLIGCETFLSAAHCFCGRVPGSACQGTSLTNPDNYLVFWQHAGWARISTITVDPFYLSDDSSVGDVALVRLAAPVTGITPSPINTTGPPPFGAVGEIAGFGRSGGDPDADVTEGVKQVGHVNTASCVPVASDATSVCWNFNDPLGPAGEDSNTCQGDSGGPLFIGNAVAGITSFGTSATCLPPDHSVDASVYYHRQWIQDHAGADVGNTSCGNLPQAGQSGTAILAAGGLLDVCSPTAIYSLDVPPDTRELRIALNGTFTGDADLYVKAGSPPTSNDYVCQSTDVTSFEYCGVLSPARGTWFVMVQQASGLPVYQLTATTFGVVCADGDLSVYKARFARKFLVKGWLSSRPGLDPRSDDFTLTVTDDGGGRLDLSIPAGDPGWSSNPGEGLYRWRGYVNGLKVVKLVGGGSLWSFRLKGKNVAGAAALGFSGLRYTLSAGGACASTRAQ